MKQRVLIVDDDRLVADTLSLVYKLHGYDSEACYSAAEGLDRARTFGPSLMVCDVTMPGENGLSLAEKMNTEMPGCEMLMLTAYSSNAAKVQMQSLRMKRNLKVLPKPCPPDVLMRESRMLLPQDAA